MSLLVNGNGIGPEVLFESEITHSLETSPLGITFLGGVALFNPDSNLLEPLEKQTLAYAMLGVNTRQITKKVGLTAPAVGMYLSRARGKTGAPSNAGLLDYALITPEDSPPVMIMTRRASQNTFGQLNKHELKIAGLVARGLSNREIAESLDIRLNIFQQLVPSLAIRIGAAGNRELLATGTVLAGYTGKWKQQSGETEIPDTATGE